MELKLHLSFFVGLDLIFLLSIILDELNVKGNTMLFAVNDLLDSYGLR